MLLCLLFPFSLSSDVSFELSNTFAAERYVALCSVGVYIQLQILALKLCMTCVFAPDGTREPATLLQVLPSTIVQFLEHGKALVAYGRRSYAFKSVASLREPFFVLLCTG